MSTIRVTILPIVSNFQYKGKTYVPGNIVEIPEKLFRSDFMQKVVEPASQPVTKEKANPIAEEKPAAEQKPAEEAKTIPEALKLEDLAKVRRRPSS